MKYTAAQDRVISRMRETNGYNRGYIGSGHDARSLTVLAREGVAVKLADGWWLTEVIAERSMAELHQASREVMSADYAPTAALSADDVIPAARQLTPEETKAAQLDYLKSIPGRYNPPAERMPIGPRGEVHSWPADRPGWGSSRSWRRTINGHHYSFTVVNMPNGEVRLSVGRYNGYGDSNVQLFGATQAEADANGMAWACAWDRVHFVKIPPARMPIGERSEIFTMAPITADGTTVRTWSREVNGRDYHFHLSYGPNVLTRYTVTIGRACPVLAHYLILTPWSACRICGSSDMPTNDDDMCEYCVADVADRTLAESFPFIGKDNDRPVSDHPAYDATADAVGIDPSPEWTRLGDVEVFSLSRPAGTEVPPWPRFGVLVEYYDDEQGAVFCVVGNFATWDEAREERDRLEADGRFEYVRGTIPLYGSVSDF